MQRTIYLLLTAFCVFVATPSYANGLEAVFDDSTRGLTLGFVASIPFRLWLFFDNGRKGTSFIVNALLFVIFELFVQTVFCFSRYLVADIFINWAIGDLISYVFWFLCSVATILLGVRIFSIPPDKRLKKYAAIASGLIYPAAFLLAKSLTHH